MFRKEVYPCRFRTDRRAAAIDLAKEQELVGMVRNDRVRVFIAIPTRQQLDRFDEIAGFLAHLAPD